MIKKLLANRIIFSIIWMMAPAGLSFTSLHAQSRTAGKVFTVVIDPGHGGKDSGTKGTGKTKIYEKDVVLAIGKKVKEILHKEAPEIRVIMTRDTDKFIELRKRAEIANKNKADVFVSIHCNANPNKKVRGSETYVLGIHRNKDNLEVAKKENAVIKLEDDYKLHYKGFDPDSPETFIGLEVMQEEFLDQSIWLASLVQKEYLKRVHTKNRSVQKAGFAVLRLTYMPSILTEVGFLSNPAEEKFLQSAEGQEKIALSIARAIIQYKKLIRQNSEISTNQEPVNLPAPSKKHTSAGTKPHSSTTPKPVTKPKTSQTTASQSVVAKADDSHSKVSNVNCPTCYFSVQIAMSRKRIKPGSSFFHGLHPVFSKKFGNVYKYFYGKTTNFEEIKSYQQKARQNGFKDAFIVGFKNGNRVPAASILKK